MPQVLANGWCCLPGMVAVSGAGAPMLRSALNSNSSVLSEGSPHISALDSETGSEPSLLTGNGLCKISFQPRVHLL